VLDSLNWNLYLATLIRPELWRIDSSLHIRASYENGEQLWDLQLEILLGFYFPV